MNASLMEMVLPCRGRSLGATIKPTGAQRWTCGLPRPDQRLTTPGAERFDAIPSEREMGVVPVRPGRFSRAVSSPRGSTMPTSTEAEQSQWFLPEPEPRSVRYTVISVDDHLVEPAHVFEGRLPVHLQDRAPRIVENQQGHQVWEFE